MPRASMLLSLPLLSLLAAACAAPDSAVSTPTPPPTPYGDRPPNHAAPPAPPYSADTALLAARVQEAIEKYDKDRWERFVDATDAGELASDLRLTQAAVDAGQWKKEWLFNNGDELFEHDFTDAEGFGPGHFRVQRGAMGGPDALSCNECHHEGGFDGSGEVSQNAFFDGNGKDASSAFERNAPAALGMGFEQRLAEEMTAQLGRTRADAVTAARATRSTVTRELIAKGVRFGSIIAHDDGTLDTSQVAGVDGDLVVKPFGWKGAVSNLHDFVIDGFQRHHGIQIASPTAPGDGPAWDRDKDGVPAEMTDGMVTSVVVYLSMLETPVMIPPRDQAMLERHHRGEQLFDSIGCASCHVPSLPLADPKLVVSPTVTIDLLAEGEAPRPRRDVYYGDTTAAGPGTPVFLFSDLKRHAMGDALAEARPTVQGIARDQFLTRPLWGVAETAPYLHDGRAETLDEAILDHGGEAQAARDAFARLPAASKGDLRVFLLSLTRYPRVDYR